jgi:alkanesulfonate monooxygenase SsuD/methylene tetrahydromethanopterin reductase-like flavin-dependent oxidoreductase (luciferase family)/predicted kinase
MTGPELAERIPEPAVVVLVGASGSGKSTWAQARYRRQEIVSSDDLRGVIGSGRHDLDATDDAFRLLDQIVAARTSRSLTTVIDTLGLDVDKRMSYLALARRAGLPAVAVLFDTPAELSRQRNANRDRPVPAPALTRQSKQARGAVAELESEAWDRVVTVMSGPAIPVRRQQAAEPVDDVQHEREVILQISRFPWGDDPASWLKQIALAADATGFAGLALMDHLIQIPQIGRAWEPIPEPFTTLGLLAGLDTKLQLGTLCTPVTFRRGGIVAKTVATLDVLSGGRAFVGIGAGWFEREHQAFGLPMPRATERLDELERSIETMRALWLKGTKPFRGEHVDLPETTSYPRPLGEPRIIVGGSGDRTLRIAAELGDACNLRTTDELDERLGVFEKHRNRTGREVAVTVLDLPVIGRDREDVWQRVERHRGRKPAAAFAQVRHAATVAETAERHRKLFDRGISTIFIALPDLDSADDVVALEPLVK